MIPPGFEWRPHIHDAPALYLNGHMIAQTTAIESAVRVGLHPNLAICRFRMFRDAPSAARFIEAWATKWETALRETYPLSRPHAPAPREPSPMPKVRGATPR